jgi:DNA-binding transcriptional ArsR family regulator
MILSIARASKDGVPVGMFVERLTLSQPTVSHHLRVLREAGLVEGERRGIYVYYRVVPEAVDALSRALAA